MKLKTFKLPRPRFFPLACLLLIVFGFAGLSIAEATNEYIATGNEIIEQIPELEFHNQDGTATLYGHGVWNLRDRPDYEVVEIGEPLNQSSAVYLYYDVETPTMPGDEVVWPITVYIVDEENLSRYETGLDFCHISKSYDVAGQTYALVPHNDTYYVIFDNTNDNYARDNAQKDVNYNIRCVVPEHVERFKTDPETGETQLGKSLKLPFYGMILVGIIGFTWWTYTETKIQKNKNQKTPEKHP